MNYVKKSILSLALCALVLNSQVFAMENGAGHDSRTPADLARERLGATREKQQIAVEVTPSPISGISDGAKDSIKPGGPVDSAMVKLYRQSNAAAGAGATDVSQQLLGTAAAGRRRRASEGDADVTQSDKRWLATATAGAQSNQANTDSRAVEAPRVHSGSVPDINQTIGQPAPSRTAPAIEIKAAVDANANAVANNTPAKPKSYLDRFNELSKTQKTVGVGLGAAAVVAGAGVVAYKKNDRFKNFVDGVGAGVKNNFNYYVGDPVKKAYKEGLMSQATAIKVGVGGALAASAGYWLNKNHYLDSVKKRAVELKDAAKANKTKAVGIAALATLAGAAVYRVYKYATGAKQTKTQLVIAQFAKTISEKQRTESITKLLSAAEQNPVLLRDPAFFNNLSAEQRKLVQTAIGQWITDNPNDKPQWQQEILNLAKLLEPTPVNNKIIYDAFKNPLPLKTANFEKVTKEQNKTVEALVETIIKVWADTKPEILPEWQSDILKLGQAVAKTVDNDRILNAALYDPHQMITNSKFFNSLTNDQKSDVNAIIIKWNSINPDAVAKKKAELFATFCKELNEFYEILKKSNKAFAGLDGVVKHVTQDISFAQDFNPIVIESNPVFVNSLDENEQLMLVALKSLVDSLNIN